MADLLYEMHDGIGVVTLNRPDRLNAISFEMLDALGRTLAEADRDPQVRCLVLTGAGKGFCSGLDLKDAMEGKGIGGARSEERRVGKECRSRWCTYQSKQKHEMDT